jgi:hypothetical protein
MENQANLRKASALVNIIRVVGILFFIASGLGVIRWTYGVILGIACFMLGPAILQYLAAKKS